MPKPEIIGSSRSTYTRVVCMVCEEKGIEYVLTQTLLRAPEILAIHPFGKMPVLRHGDVELCESKAIATYLDRSFPGPQVIPSDARLAALTEQWVSLINTVMDDFVRACQPRRLKVIGAFTPRGGITTTVTCVHEAGSTVSSP